ncbi:MAG: hypothetical protein ACJAVS_002731 [Paracoccaceae bacterium]|jgi:hypothetical protein
MAWLRLTLTDRRTFNFQPTRRGDPEQPVTRAALIAKFDRLAGAAPTAEGLVSLRDITLTGGRLPMAPRPLSKDEIP